MQFETSDQIRLDYHVFGKGQPLVLVAGFAGYQQIWARQIPFLVAQGFQVITYDHRNHGASQRTTKSLNMQRLLLDLKELITGLDLKQPILIGHSMGASLCYGALGQFPEKLTAVVAVDQTPQMLAHGAWSPDFKRWLLQNVTGTFKRPLDPLVKKVLTPAERLHPFPFVPNLPLLVDHARQDWRSDLQNSQLPILLVVASHSWYFDWHFILPYLQKQNIHVVRLKSGHEVMAERPGTFNRVLGHFLTTQVH
ncbi:alpha beta superfamily hydrolase [Lactobacillus selangorensis]|uniref:Alpha beta superfamily hydrolase n=1 Tax=Lactobacillus selangorensis TaxID=81857 RepID=A0A0R2FHN2_9LACO|nr:alpha/beta hydrolase [Lactobacillus selangorensis]KRN28143.1 alpha beta superfamily hydrolase [Lactobacillus selangorensis]KRN30980.1 alpha beta superfamily hydrolase [Lactobacillus selangorensis]